MGAPWPPPGYATESHPTRYRRVSGLTNCWHSDQCRLSLSLSLAVSCYLGWNRFHISVTGCADTIHRNVISTWIEYVDETWALYGKEETTHYGRRWQCVDSDRAYRMIDWYSRRERERERVNETSWWKVDNVRWIRSRLSETEPKCFVFEKSCYAFGGQSRRFTKVNVNKVNILLYNIN